MKTPPFSPSQFHLSSSPDMRRGGGSGDRQATGTENIQPETTEAYGRWIGARWAHRTNLVWAIGGDQRWHQSDLPHYEALARGLRDGGAQGPFTLHPWDAFSDVDQTGQSCVSEAPHACPLVQWRGGRNTVLIILLRHAGHSVNEFIRDLIDFVSVQSHETGEGLAERVSEFAVPCDTCSSSAARAGLPSLLVEPYYLESQKHCDEGSESMLDAAAVRHTLNGSTCAHHYTPLDVQVARAAEASTRTRSLSGRPSGLAGSAAAASVMASAPTHFGWASMMRRESGREWGGVRRST